MNKMKKALKGSLGTGLLAAAAGLLLLGGTVGSTQAALTWRSENYTSRVEMQEIGVSLVENDQDVSGKELLTGLLGEGEQLALNKTYPEALTVTNSGVIDEYVRVTIYRYWMNTDADGNPTSKNTTISPEWIHLNLTNNWILDESASTDERLVLYYPKALASGETAEAITDGISIDSAIANKMTKSEPDANGVITTTYDYDGARFTVEVQVDAVQTHNAEDAIKSAWGVDASIAEDGSFSIVR